MRHPGPIVRIRGRVHPGQELPIQIPHNALDEAVFGERQTVATQPPEDRHQAGDAQALGQDGQDILAPHQAAVKQRQAGQRHEQHQSSADHLEPIVAGARPTDLGVQVGVGRVASRAVVHVGFQVREPLLDAGSFEL